ncbi:hypothetical protein ACE1CD_17715 [Aerosakkonema sp. BLCC-F183]
MDKKPAKDASRTKISSAAVDRLIVLAVRRWTTYTPGGGDT